MTSHRPTLRQLDYLIAVADTLHFRKAADRCHVSQSALSAQLSQLEDSLGVVLFERDKRHVLITPIGKRLAEEARAILRRAEALSDIVDSLGEPLSQELRLGVIPTVAPYLMPRVIDHLRSEFPKLRLLLREDQTARIVDLLERGELDLLLLALDVEVGSATTHELFRDPFVLACRTDHPLATKDLIAEKDLQGQEVLLLEEGHCLRDHALPICNEAGACEIGDFRASSLSTLVQMVAGGLGITLVPEMAADYEAGKNPSLAIRPFDHEGPCRRIGLAWRATSPRANEFRRFGEALTRAYIAAE